MKRRALLVLCTILSLFMASGSGRPGAASAYTLPACVLTYERTTINLMWLTDARRKPGSELYIAERLISPTPFLVVTDAGEGDHWNVAVSDAITEREIWRQDGLSPLEDASIPVSVWKEGGLFSIKTERYMKDGRQVSSSALIEIADRSTYESLRGWTRGLDDSLYYDLKEDGAVSVRLTLKDESTGKDILTTLLPVPGMAGDSAVSVPHADGEPIVEMISSDGKPVVHVRLSKYLNDAHVGKKLSVSWEELDAAGAVLTKEDDAASFTLRASLAPRWKQGGGQVAAPDGTVEWEPVKGARWYQLSVTNHEGEQVATAVAPGTATQHTFSKPLDPGFHWVKISAEGGGCRQDWGDALPLLVDQMPWRGILSPAAGALTETDLTVRVRRADWIKSYQVELLDNQSGKPLQTKRWYSFQAGDSVTFDVSKLVPGQTYRIRATADLTIPVPQVDQVTFTYSPPIRLGFKEALQGARLAKADLPLSWELVPGAKSYSLLLTRVTGFVNLQTRIPVGSASGYTILGQTLESGRTYRLSLEVTMTDGSTRSSDPVTFTVK